MCYFCDGNLENYQAYSSKVAALKKLVVDDKTFLLYSAEADRLRVGRSPEWSEDTIVMSVRDHIFQNPDPDEGLLLFFLTAWLDLQAPYITVWNHWLCEAKTWLQTTAWIVPTISMPRGKFEASSTQLLKTINTLSSSQYSRSISSWFANIVVKIVRSHPAGTGNIYRFVDAICADFYYASSSSFLKSMHKGMLPTNYRGPHFKRLWMLIMFLRRDNHVIRCLLKRALATVEHGAEAFEYWTDDSKFDPVECELPVDRRVQEAWNKLLFVYFPRDKVELVARDARELARRNNRAPASFDAILFFR